MTAQRKELASLQKPPDGYSWSPDASEHPRATVGVYKSLAQGGAVPWQASPDGARRDAEPADNLPTLTPGINVLPARCSGCGSCLLDEHEAVNGERRGMLSCTACGRQLAWLAPRITVLPPTSPSAVTDAAQRARNLPIGHSMAPVHREDWRRPTCGLSCRRERVMLMGGRNGFEWREYHDADAHDRRDVCVAVVRTGPLVVDMAQRRVFVHGRDRGITPIEFAILAHLAGRLGRLCPAHDIAADVSRNASHRDGKASGSVLEMAIHGIRVHLARLRPKLGEARHLIENRPGLGYLLRRVPPEGNDAQSG